MYMSICLYVHMAICVYLCQYAQPPAGNNCAGAITKKIVHSIQNKNTIAVLAATLAAIEVTPASSNAV